MSDTRTVRTRTGFDEELVGLAEVARMLGLGKPATVRRVRQPDFPGPLARLESGPVWAADDVREYARRRVERFVERPEIEALAREAEGMPSTPRLDRLAVAAEGSDPAPPPLPPDVMPLPELVALTGLDARRWQHLFATRPNMPGATYQLSTFTLRGVHRASVATWIRALRPETTDRELRELGVRQ